MVSIKTEWFVGAREGLKDRGNVIPFLLHDTRVTVT